MIPRRMRYARLLSGCCALAALPVVHGQETAASPVRPIPAMNRWQEDWSSLADPSLRTEPGDGWKYHPLAPLLPDGWLSLGLTLRERYEQNDAVNFGVNGAPREAYLLQRLQVHADLHLDSHWRLFTQLEDARAWAKDPVTPVDQNPLDLRLAFAEYVQHTAAGTLKARVGRQDFAFDLQRFVSSRDGPNVRQSFDAVWADWETADWRFIAFVSEPVQYLDSKPFDDHSNSAFRFHTVRVERHVLGDNELSAYWSVYERANARYIDASGLERRDLLDARFAGKSGAVDWDLEAMGQSGRVGATAIRAWAGGAGAGWTLEETAGKPRLGLQLDAASGDSRRGDGALGTFNPLFPNGYYFSLAGYTGYANLVQVKPTLTLHSATGLVTTFGAGLLWRETTGDAVYVQPNVPVAGTAGEPGRRTGTYWQARADYRVDRLITTAIEVVHDDVSQVIRRVGGRDSDYVGIEFKLSW